MIEFYVKNVQIDNIKKHFPKKKQIKKEHHDPVYIIFGTKENPIILDYDD